MPWWGWSMGEREVADGRFASTRCPSHPATTDGRPGGESSSSSRFLLVFGAVKRESIE
jgi:hypothetical protein